MADVIFAGTPSRPALGMAEVKLVIDNSAGKISVPMSEIEVSRTIFRSGESEYRVNGQVVRLLDVQELLSETGIGRALHTVVGQGQLEEVLLARPEERRKYIEEAAGIAKHRRRKERAERKLSRARPGPPAAAGRAGRAPPAAEAPSAAGRDGDEARDADGTGRGARAQARRRPSARVDARARAVARADGTRARDARKAARELLDGLDGEVLQAADDRARRRARARRRGAARSARLRPSAPMPTRRSARPSSATRTRARTWQPRPHGRRASTASIGTWYAPSRSWRASSRSSRPASTSLIGRGTGVPRGRGSTAARSRTSGDGRARRPLARRAEVEALRRSISSSERERERMDEDARGRQGADRHARRSSGERLEADIERAGRPDVAARRPADAARAGAAALTEKIEELEDVAAPASSADRPARGPAARHRGDARLAVPGRHQGHAVGLLGDLVRIEAGLERPRSSRRSARSPTPSCTRTGTVPLADAPGGDGAIFAIARGGPVALGLRRRASAALGRRGRARRARDRQHGAPRRLPRRRPSRRPSTKQAGAPGRIVRHARRRAGRAPP